MHLVHALQSVAFPATSSRASQSTCVADNVPGLSFRPITDSTVHVYRTDALPRAQHRQPETPTMPPKPFLLSYYQFLRVDTRPLHTATHLVRSAVSSPQQ